MVDIKMDRIHYFLYLIDHSLKENYIDIILILIIPLIALRGFLFKSGYYFYSDQAWPLSNYIYANGILSFNSLSGFGFSRLIIDWPYYIITLFTNSVMVTERAFIYYKFVLYLFFAYIFATMITTKFLQTKNKYEIIVIKFIIVLFIFSNFTALNLINDGGSFTDNLNLIFIAIILLAFIAWKNMKLAFLISTVLLTISILVEPDYTTFYIISIIVGSIMSGLINRDFLYRLKYAILTVIAAIIPIAFVILGLVLTSSAGSTVTAVGALRVYNFGTISFFSGNINPLYPLILIGHLWSTIVYAPPNILLYGDKISSVKALMSPSQLLLPDGFITYIWLFTVIMVPIISLISIVFRKTRKIALPVIILFIIFYTMSLVYYIKPLFYLELYISEIPLIGGSIGTTLSLPGHIINVIASMYYILFSITLINLMNLHFHVDIKSDKDKFNINISIIKNYIGNIKNEKYFKSNKFQVFVVIFIIFIVIFSGWQAFDGTFYPARSPDIPYGNNVNNIGGYTPLDINSSVIHTYDFISYQKSNFNILWIGGPAFSNRVYESPHPEASIPNLNYITSNNLSLDFYYNLLYSDVKYVVISNQDIQKNPINIYVNTFSDAGFKNFTYAQSFLQNNTGLKEIYNKYSVDIFEVKGFKTIYNSNLLINYKGADDYNGVLPYLFKTLGYNIAITGDNNYGVPVYSNNNSKNISIDTPEYILTNMTDILNYKYDNLNSTLKLSGSGHNFGTGLPDNFTLTLWSGNETCYTYNYTVLNITNYNNSDQSVSYNGSFDSGSGGYYVNNNNVTLTVSFYAKATNNGTGSLIFMGEPKTNIKTDNIYIGHNFNVSSAYKKYTFSYTFPNTEEYIDFRLYDTFDGSFHIKNLTTKYEKVPTIKQNSTLPYGNYVILNDTILKFNNDSTLVYMKNSTMNSYKWVRFNGSEDLYIKNNTDIAAIIVVKTNTSLNCQNKSFILSIYPSAKEYKLSYGNKLYSSIPGIYGNSIFIINKNITSLNDVKIITKGKVIMDIFYIGIIIYLAMLSWFLVDIYRKNKTKDAEK